MYGKKIHRTVIEHRELKSGISIHYVNENYDEGANIYQKETKVKIDIQLNESSLELLMKTGFHKYIKGNKFIL